MASAAASLLPMSGGMLRGGPMAMSILSSGER